MNPINLTFVLAITMILVLIRLATSSENYVVSNNSGYFEGEQSDPALANLIVTNDEKIKYATDPYPLNTEFRARAAAFDTADGRPRGEGSDLDPTVCLYNQGQNMVSDMYGVNNEGFAGNQQAPPHTTKKDILQMYDMLQGPVDLGMANKMSATDKHAKQSFTNRSRMNRRAFNKYFVEELEATANRGGWWDQDTLDQEM